MSARPMTLPLRYPTPANWDAELDDLERPFIEQHWETDTPVVAHPDRLALAGAILPARSRPHPRRDAPWWQSWVVMWVCWPIAALSLVGLLVGAGG